MSTRRLLAEVAFRTGTVAVLLAAVVVSFFVDPGTTRTVFTVLGVLAGVTIFGFGLEALVHDRGRIFSAPYPLGTAVLLTAFLFRDSSHEWAYLTAAWIGIVLIVIEAVAWSRSSNRKRREKDSA